jgi:membrane protein DedA with SNARE-associated domain/membrane-associated phospholipid phosphatase
MISGIAERILGLHGWAAIAVVFLLPALEASAFVGFLFPGEIGVLLGGVLASQHKVGVEAVLVAGVAGAIIGDSVGYEVGKRWGRRMLEGSIGRFVKTDHLDRAGAYLQTRGGKAVFFGRFTAALRVLIPGLAGMSGLRYSRFLAYNAAGGAVWATGFVLTGYVAGDSWPKVEHFAGRASVVLLLLAVLAAAVFLAARWADQHQERVRAFVVRQLDRPSVAMLRARYRRQIAFLARRLRPGGALGLSLTASLVALVGVGWALSIVVKDVVVGHGSIRFDGPVLRWFARHREPWLTTVMRIVTDMGSSAFLIPLVLVVGAWYWRRLGKPRPMVLLGAAYGGSELLSQAIRALAGRARPPAGLAVGHFHGYSFPSGHTTNSTAVYGMLAVVLASSTPRWGRKVSVWAGAVSIGTAVGITRLYLGAHWLTDVLGGWALGTVWLLVVATVLQAIGGRRSAVNTAPETAGAVPDADGSGVDELRSRGVPLGPGEKDRQPEDRGHEQGAGAGGAEPEPAVAAGPREVVADGGPERPGEDVGQPEGQDGVQPEPEVRAGSRGDETGEQQRRHPVAQVELLGHQVAGGGAEGEGEENGQPVEGFPPRCEDRVDREGPLV